MRWHPGRRIVYLAHPRTASVATEAALEARGFEDPLPEHSRHAGLDRLGIDERDGWEVWTTVRNHWDAMVSFAHWKVFDLPFGAEYVEALVRTTAEYIAPPTLWPFTGDATRVLRFETLASDLADALGTGEVEVPRLNVSEGREGRHYRHHYDGPARRRVGELFEPEIRRLGYTY